MPQKRPQSVSCSNSGNDNSRNLKNCRVRLISAVLCFDGINQNNGVSIPLPGFLVGFEDQRAADSVDPYPYLLT